MYHQSFHVLSVLEVGGEEWRQTDRQERSEREAGRQISRQAGIQIYTQTGKHIQSYIEYTFLVIEGYTHTYIHT